MKEIRMIWLFQLKEFHNTMRKMKRSILNYKMGKKVHRFILSVLRSRFNLSNNLRLNRKIPHRILFRKAIRERLQKQTSDMSTTCKFNTILRPIAPQISNLLEASNLLILIRIMSNRSCSKTFSDRSINR